MRGVGGVVRDQTSELSRHRSEAAAREAAEAERERLVILRPDEAALYRIAVHRDDEVVLDVAVVGDESPLDLPPTGPAPAYDVPPDETVYASAESTAELEAVPDPPERAEPSASASASRRPPDDVPDGPVPDDVIARFADSIERERVRDEAREAE